MEPGVYTTGPDAKGNPQLLVKHCVRGWWRASVVNDAARGDDRRTLGKTRAEAVRRYRAGEYDAPCPGCTCGASSLPHCQGVGAPAP